MKRILTICALAAIAACGEAERELNDDPVLEGTEVTVVEATEGPDGLLPPALGEDAWALDRSASSIVFTGVHGDEGFTGRFGTFDAAITLDPDELEAAQITAAVDLGSVDAGTTERNESLPEADWFDIARHPRATFRSTEVRRVGDGRYEADGVLSIKGVDRPVTMPFTLTVAGDRAVADAAITLDRTAYGIGQGEFASEEWVGVSVSVAIHVEAERV
jgi:polyisoprenoid-binding protein YceI